MTGDGAGGETGRMVAFLREIGIRVELTALPEGTFLPGLAIRDGGLVVDLDRLRYPGDLLHESAHVALVEPAVRPLLNDDIDVPGVDLAQLEVAAIPWSYAAALHVGVDPAVVFHDGGYRGHARGLLTTFGFGIYPGVPLLEAFGLTATPARAAELGVAPYPHMLRWLRGAPAGP